jgi:hypothetical protein
VHAFFMSQGSQLFMPSLCLMSKSYSWIIKTYLANFHVIVENFNTLLVENHCLPHILHLYHPCC